MRTMGYSEAKVGFCRDRPAGGMAQGQAGECHAGECQQNKDAGHSMYFGVEPKRSIEKNLDGEQLGG